MGKKVLTLDQLKIRGRTLVNRCFLCEEEEEMVDHLLVHCCKARLMWGLLFAIIGVRWAFPSTVRDTLISWHGSFVGKKQRKAWLISPLCLFWTIWRVRNKIVFDNEEILILRMKTSFCYNLWSWTKLHTADGPNFCFIF